MRRLISVASLVIIMLVFGVTSDSFYCGQYIEYFAEASVTGIIAIGVTFVIITAGIDLSTGATIGFAGMLCANLLYHYNLPAGVIMLISVLTGLACGAVNGFIITKLRVPEFIATLSTQYLFRSLWSLYLRSESPE